LPVGGVFALASAWVAMVVQTDFGFAPLVIFPLLIGVGLGAMLVGLMRLTQVGHRSTVAIGSVAIALITVIALHYIGYLKTYRWPRDNADQPTPRAWIVEIDDFDEHMLQRAELGIPLAWGYTARGPGAWLTWTVDGLLVLAAALAVVVPAVRLPYCNRCRTWYRVIRSGRIDVESGRALAEAVGLAVPERAVAVRYRLLACNGGCGPGGLDLSWEQPRQSARSMRTWLTTEQRDRVARALDEVNAPHESS